MGSKQEKEYVKAVYCHHVYLTSMQSTSCEMPGHMKYKLESRLQGEILITSDMQVLLLLLHRFSHVQLCATPQTAAQQAAPSLGFSRQEYFSGLPFPFPTKELLLLLSRFSRVRLCATPQTAAHQAPPSLGFSRQEYWSGLPFPAPMHESGK